MATADAGKDQARPEACGTDEAGSFEVQDNEQEVVVWAELPGLAESDLDVQVQGERLTIKAGRFSREVPVPAGTPPGKVQATYINGVLEVRVPKA